LWEWLKEVISEDENEIDSTFLYILKHDTNECSIRGIFLEIQRIIREIFLKIQRITSEEFDINSLDCD